jgi:large subunit ribosomal protein L24
MQTRLKKNDMVQVISGAFRGATGKISKIDLDAGRVAVDSDKVDKLKKHVKASQKNPQGGLIDIARMLHMSNVALLCPKCNRGVRHGVRVESKGDKKIRFCKKCDSSLEA